MALKVLLCICLQNNDDIFTLVEHIEPGGSADGKLQIGDWIRSVNGQPLQTPREVLITDPHPNPLQCLLKMQLFDTGSA